MFSCSPGTWMMSIYIDLNWHCLVNCSTCLISNRKKLLKWILYFLNEHWLMIVWQNTFFREPKGWNGAERRDSQSPGPNTPGAEQFVKCQQSKEKENSETVPHYWILKNENFYIPTIRCNWIFTILCLVVRGYATTLHKPPNPSLTLFIFCLFGSISVSVAIEIVL